MSNAYLQDSKVCRFLIFFLLLLYVCVISTIDALWVVLCRKETYEKYHAQLDALYNLGEPASISGKL